MKSLGITLIISFLAIAGFSLTVIDHGAPLHSGLTGCLASLLTGSACSENFSPYAAASFHLDAFKNFVTAIPSFALWLIGFLSLAFLLTASLSRYPATISKMLRTAGSRQRRGTLTPPARMQGLKWLSRLEARDPSLI